VGHNSSRQVHKQVSSRVVRQQQQQAVLLMLVHHPISGLSCST
jgi:hypothetical protein